MKTLHKISTIKKGNVTIDIIIQLAKLMNEIIDNQNEIIEQIRDLKNAK